MSSRCRRVLVFFIGLVVLLGPASIAYARELRVCADPDNLPFSNRREQGFENRIADLLGKDLHAQLHYVWQREGKGFVREYINKGICDLLIGIPAGYRPLLTTTPYYRSTYVFVVRRDQKLVPASLNDPVLHEMKKIGVQVLEDDYTPPAEALARRGMQSEIVGFQTVGENPAAIIRAVATRKIDGAIVWGPFAGYYARTVRDLVLKPVEPEVDPPGLPLTFAISMGVRKGNTQLKSEIEAFLRTRRQQIQSVLAHYGVPQLELAPEVVARK